MVGTSVGAINGALVAADPGGAAARLARLWQGDELREAFSESVRAAGLDQLASVADVWRSLPIGHAVQARWWRVPAAEVPRSGDHEAQVRWLYDWWARIDAWIEQNSAQPGRTPADETLT